MSGIYSLRNKVVVLDPGHGLGVTGAIGKGGTIEADVNLKVANYLRQLLIDEGAIVYLTTEHMKEESLDTRVELSKKFGAEVFISIHHNATSPPDPLRNRIEVYYPWDGSADVKSFAYFIGNSLARFSGLPLIPPLPARYRVLVGNVPLSILLEPAYISNRKMELLLNSDNYLRGEAQAIFEGLITFITSPQPRINSVRFSQRRAYLSFYVSNPKGSSQDFYWRLCLNDEKVITGIGVIRSKMFVDLSHLPSGSYRARLSVAVPEGRTTENEFEFKIHRSAKKILIVNIKEFSGVTVVTANVVDKFNHPTCAELYVSPNPLFIERADNNRWVIIFDRSGKYRFYSGSVSKLLTVKVKPGKWLRVVDLHGNPINGATVTIKGKTLQKIPALSGGYIPIPENVAEVFLSAKGYNGLEVSKLSGYKTFTLQAKNTNLLGRRVVILIERIAQNLFVFANLLREILEDDGIKVILLEPGEITKDEVLNIKRVEQFTPDVVLVFTANFRWKEGVYYYYRDKDSRRLAELIANALKEVKPDIIASEGATYFLIQAKPTRVLCNLFVVEGGFARKVGGALVSYIIRKSSF